MRVVILSRKEEQKVSQVMGTSPALPPGWGQHRDFGKDKSPGSNQHMHVSSAFPQRASKCFRNGNSQHPCEVGREGWAGKLRHGKLRSVAAGGGLGPASPVMGRESPVLFPFGF